ncbi:RDD family protein [Derxia lacustris]|uniref:RDD family protein n=1 Tax=Derxia lacustris TaxID=764842 RepID=UPI000A175BEF|nr:RDD family protein [Derxia lacustris]
MPCGPGAKLRRHVEPARPRPFRRPPPPRRFASALYEGCLLFGVTFLAGYLFITLSQSRWPMPPERLLAFRLYLFFVVGLYFVWFWRRGGQTLAMKTWRIRLVGADGGAVALLPALLRYLLLWTPMLPAAAALVALPAQPLLALPALLGTVLLQWGWALVDRERQFLHDRLLGTRLVAA